MQSPNLQSLCLFHWLGRVKELLNQSPSLPFRSQENSLSKQGIRLAQSLIFLKELSFSGIRVIFWWDHSRRNIVHLLGFLWSLEEDSFVSSFGNCLKKDCHVFFVFVWLVVIFIFLCDKLLIKICFDMLCLTCYGCNRCIWCITVQILFGVCICCFSNTILYNIRLFFSFSLWKKTPSIAHHSNIYIISWKFDFDLKGTCHFSNMLS